VTSEIGLIEVAASLVLIVLTIVPAMWLQLGVTQRVLIAVTRAAVQLMAVGYLIKFIVGSEADLWLAYAWVAAMVVTTAIVARRRSPTINRIVWIALVAIGTATALCLGVIFGLGVLEFEPLTLIVVAGITIGNTLPSVVLAGNRVVATFRDQQDLIDGVVALGADRREVIRFVGGEIVRTALIPQIERTNVVGLIALPGAMTGLLLAGVDPIDAVLTQLIVMYLVLGSVSWSVVVTTVVSLFYALDRGFSRSQSD
jgi:putative ABC transport system permease protein